MKYNPVYVLLRSIGLLLGGRAHFPKERVGEILVREDGQKFTVFRHVVMAAGEDQRPVPDGVFRVWFSTKATKSQTIRLSYFTVLGFLGMPGFRSKLWLYNEETGEFGGIYEWDTVEEAHHYDTSYAMKFSQWRSLPGKFRTDVFAQADSRSRVHRLQEARVEAY
jgi:hypothetical protein